MVYIYILMTIYVYVSYIIFVSINNYYFCIELCHVDASTF